MDTEIHDMDTEIHDMDMEIEFHDMDMDMEIHDMEIEFHDMDMKNPKNKKDHNIFPFLEMCTTHQILIKPIFHA
jgi:hypothetical protein